MAKRGRPARKSSKKHARPGLKAPKRGKGSGSKKIAKKMQASAGGVVRAQKRAISASRNHIPFDVLEKRAINLVSLVEKRRAEEG